jgi:hypothetical protein
VCTPVKLPLWTNRAAFSSFFPFRLISIRYICVAAREDQSQWSKFKILSYLCQLKACELLKDEDTVKMVIISLFKPEIQHIESRWSGHFL